MSGQMLGQVIGAGKSFPTSIATVWSFAGVNSKMAIHVTFAPESATAELALERSLTRMLADV